MKNTIFGFKQKKAYEFELDFTDLAILRWFVDFYPKMSKEVINSNEYAWVKYSAILEEYPILPFKSKNNLYRKMLKMVDKGILTHITIKNGGTYSYYGFGKNFNQLHTKENDSNIANNFELIWKIYPRKEGKDQAFKHYKSWLRGKEYAGRKVKLTNHQMWEAVRKYADKIEREKTEKQYIKMGSTFFNGAIMEYLDV